MQDRKLETLAVLVAEWVIGDQGMRVRLGDHVTWLVRPAKGNDEEPGACLINLDWVAAGQPELPIFVLHADDPEPPISVHGHVALIHSLQWSHPPDGELRLLSQRIVLEARIDLAVEDYLIQIEGTASDAR